jgi:hypothetical protein
LAVDGSTTADVPDQVQNITPEVTRAVVSIGGNDALLNADILDLQVTSTVGADCRGVEPRLLPLKAGSRVARGGS